MLFTTCSMLLALTISGPVTAAAPRVTATPLPGALVVTAAAPATAAPALRRAVLTTSVPADRVPDAWTIDRRETRPAALPGLYASLAALQVYDVYSTRLALGTGAHEANPLMRKVSGSSSAMLAVKALSTAATIYFTERAWKRNRKAAVIMTAALNGGMAVIVARNLRNAR